MPLYQDMVARTISETCPKCGGRLGIFDSGAGPFVSCRKQECQESWDDILARMDARKYGDCEAD